MGRRKIEIKPIKDDRNRSVTFLKRKGGLFKKAHELSVLCSVDVAVIILSGNNNKLHQFSSMDMQEMLHRWGRHGQANEHKGPADFKNGDGDDDDDENGTPPGMEDLLPHFQAQPPPFPLIRHHTPSASPPIPNGVFVANGPRGHTPQPQMGSRPSSRNDIGRMGPNMVGQPVGPPGPQPVNGFAFMAQSAIFNSQNPHSMPPNMPHGLPQPHSQYPYPQPQQHPHQMQPYVDDQRRGSGPAPFPPQPQGQPTGRHSLSPPQPPATQLPSQVPPQAIPPHMSPPPPQPQPHPMQSPPQPQQQHLLPPPPPPPQLQLPQESQSEPRPKSELVDRLRSVPLLDTKIKQAPRSKGGSIFTPIDENPSILSRHLAAFNPDPPKSDTPGRSQSIDVGSVSRGSNPNSPPSLHRINTQVQPQIKRNGSLGTIPETTFTPPSRSNSLRVGSISRPRLKVQIPDESDGGSATNESGSPRGTTATASDATSQHSRRLDSHSSGVVLPPPSPSTTTQPPISAGARSAGATGPPNPFARPHTHQSSNMKIDTPVSGLPSRFMGDAYLPSPNGFYPDLYAKVNDTNTLSPLNFGTPLVGTGPSFLRDDPLMHKRKSPEISGNGGEPDSLDALANEAKRIKVDH